MATDLNPSDAPFLSIRGLRKTYGQSVAIDGVSLDIREGEFMTFLGPSGSGKSTTLYITAGFQDPTEGTVQLAGKPLLNVPPNQRNIGMVFQRYTLFPHLSVAENVAFPLRVRGWDKQRIAERVKAMLKLVHLDQHGDRKPSQLSGGQQQRVAIARALAYNPPVLLMDEPLSALDKQLREEIQFELKRIHHDTGITILYVTHDQEEALRLSDRIAVFNKGRIEQVGTGAELYEHPATPYGLAFKYGSGGFNTTFSSGRNADGDTVKFLGMKQSFGDFTVMGAYDVSTYRGSVSNSTARSATLGATWQLRPVLLQASIGRMSVDGDHSEMLSVGARYPLSKRTYVYTDLSRFKVYQKDGTTGFGVGVNHSF